MLESIKPYYGGHPLRQICTQYSPTKLYALYRLGYHSRATGRSFRTSVRTILNEVGLAADALERQLVHAPRNKVRADFLDSMAENGKEVPLRKTVERGTASQLKGPHPGRDLVGREFKGLVA